MRQGSYHTIGAVRQPWLHAAAELRGYRGPRVLAPTQGALPHSARADEIGASQSHNCRNRGCLYRCGDLRRDDLLLCDFTDPKAFRRKHPVTASNLTCNLGSVGAPTTSELHCRIAGRCIITLGGVKWARVCCADVSRGCVELLLVTRTSHFKYHARGVHG